MSAPSVQTAGLEVRLDALEADIAAFSALSEPGAGVTRLGYTALERQAHELFSQRMRGLGATVTTDAAGNTVAELPATAPDPLAGAVGTGSHLDSVPAGGRFDGIAGVAAAMEVARIATQRAIERRRAWRFVVFAAEEGARFGQACNGSRMIAGLTGPEDLCALRDAGGETMWDAMASCGLDPAAADSARWRSDDWAGFIELHIEQGSVLESAGIPVGVVDAISGSTRLAVNVRGVASHTGGTPMHLRKDALVTASACVLAGTRIANDPSHHGTRVTVGRIQVLPGSITTIPGVVEFTVDIRDVDSSRQRRTADALIREYARIAEADGTDVTADLIGDTSPVVLPATVVDHISHAAEDLGIAYRVLPSGASHDSQQVNRVTPTGMIFVPSRDGLSHVPEEWTGTAELARGVEVLLRSMERMDAAEEGGR